MHQFNQSGPSEYEEAGLGCDIADFYDVQVEIQASSAEQKYTSALDAK